MTGKKIGRLTVLERAGRSANGNVRWLCKCRCGNFCVVDGHQLRTRSTISCGCFRREKSRQNLKSNPATAAYIGNVSGISKAWHPRTDDLRRNNQSGVTGVSYDSHQQVWVARLYYKGRYVLNRTFSEKGKAIEARRDAEDKYLGIEKSML
jgi:hypothetical protein